MINNKVLNFFLQNYAPGRIGLIGANDIVGTMIRAGQQRLTLDGKPSKWSHTFIMGEKRNDGKNDGSIYIFESDLSISIKNFRLENGVMESRLIKWCDEKIEHACVLGLDLQDREVERMLSFALGTAYEYEKPLKYPVLELVGTLIAIATRNLHKKNIFDDRYAVQCASFVQKVYQSIQRDPIIDAVHTTNTSPEKIYQSKVFTYKVEM